MTASTRQSILKTIQAHEINETQARRVADYELEYWPPDDVSALLDQLSPRLQLLGSNEPCGPRFNQHHGLPLTIRLMLYCVRASGFLWLIPLQVGAAVYLAYRSRFTAIWKELPTATFDIMSCFSEYFTFAKAPPTLIALSIEQKRALCVNRRGTFQLMTSGYSVMSHSWAETMGWNTETSWGPTELGVRKAGMPFDQLERIMDHCKVEWLWLDVLAMPEVLEDMTQEEKHSTGATRCDIINCLQSIYSNADAVIVIDSLLLRLRSGSVVDAAVTLCLSSWMTRLWPLAEARLAKRVLIRTEDSTFDLDEMISFLAQDIGHEQHRYFRLLVRLEPLRPTTAGGQRLIFFTEENHRQKRVHILEDIFHGSENRMSDVEVDHVRSIFPILGLQWQHAWTLRDGFRYLVAEYPGQLEVIKSYFHYRDNQFSWCTWSSILEPQ